MRWQNVAGLLLVAYAAFSFWWERHDAEWQEAARERILTGILAISMAGFFGTVIALTVALLGQGWLWEL